MNKDEMLDIVEKENGIRYKKNIPKNSLFLTNDTGFVIFEKRKIEKTQVLLIHYIYASSYSEVIELFSGLFDYIIGNEIKFVYFVQHRRKAIYAEKYLKSIGFQVKYIDKKWKRRWKSTNGYDERHAIEGYY